MLQKIMVKCSLGGLVAAKQALTYSTWRYPRTVSSSSLVHPTSRQQLVSSSFCRTVTPSLRSFTTFLSNSKNALEIKIGALEHLLKGGKATTASEDIRETVLIYEGSDKEYLRGMIKDLQGEKTALSSQAAVGSKGAPLSIPEGFNFNVASWEVGHVVDCIAVSEAMRSHGGFPSTIFVREEMKTTWSILVDGITKQESKWVIIGSPGVGKSILTVLLCFYLARDLNKPVFLARQLKGEGGSTGGEVAICIQPDGGIMAYPSTPDDDVDLRYVRREFGRRMRLVGCSQRLIVVLDGWAQAEMVGTMQAGFGGFDLLATSAQYNSTSQDTHCPVLLPAWNDEDLRSLWGLCGPKGEGVPSFIEQLYYSGGSARELLRPIDAIRRRIDSTIARLDKATCEGLLSQRGGSSAAGIDTLRRCYLVNTTVPEASLEPTQRRYVVDSAYALNRLRTKAPLEVYESSLTIAISCGPAHHGLMFEALVHQLFRVPNMCITFHVQPYSQHGALSDAYTSIAVGTDIRTECSGVNEAEAMDRLGNLKLDMNRGKYWHPDFPTFSVIDAVLFVSAFKTVFYIQVTVASKHDLNCEKLKKIHEAAKNALEKSTDAKGWVFKYVAIAQSQEQAENLVLKDGGRILSVLSVDEVTISKGYVTYAIE